MKHAKEQEERDEAARIRHQGEILRRRFELQRKIAKVEAARKKEKRSLFSRKWLDRKVKINPDVVRKNVARNPTIQMLRNRLQMKYQGRRKRLRDQIDKNQIAPLEKRLAECVKGFAPVIEQLFRLDREYQRIRKCLELAHYRKSRIEPETDAQIRKRIAAEVEKITKQLGLSEYQRDRLTLRKKYGYYKKEGEIIYVRDN